MDIKKFVCNMFQENCYVVSDETNECVIIDCGAFYEEEKEAIINYVRNNGLTPKHLLCTHGHLDHNFGNKAMFEAFGIKPEICIADEKMLECISEQAAVLAGINYNERQPDVARFFSDGDTVTFGSHVFKVICTPGHSPGCVFFYCKEESVAFSGDTLFRMSIGRTDFMQGDYNAIINSIRNIVAKLPPETEVFPGHGPKTTIVYEIENNPYLRM